MLDLQDGDVVTLCSERPPYWNHAGDMDYLLGADLVFGTDVTTVIPGHVYQVSSGGNWLISGNDIVEINHLPVVS